jgi:hypothetical protein
MSVTRRLEFESANSQDMWGYYVAASNLRGYRPTTRRSPASESFRLSFQSNKEVVLLKMRNREGQKAEHAGAHSHPSASVIPPPGWRRCAGHRSKPPARRSGRDETEGVGRYRCAHPDSHQIAAGWGLRQDTAGMRAGTEG